MEQTRVVVEITDAHVCKALSRTYGRVEKLFNRGESYNAEPCGGWRESWVRGLQPAPSVTGLKSSYKPWEGLSSCHGVS